MAHLKTRVSSINFSSSLVEGVFYANSVACLDREEFEMPPASPPPYLKKVV